MNDKQHSVADTPLPVPFDNSPFTPYRLLQILNFAADTTCSALTPLTPEAEAAKVHTFDSLLLRMPVSHIPYQKIAVLNNKQQLIDSEYCAYVEENAPGCMHIIHFGFVDGKTEDGMGSCLLSTGSVILDTQLRIPYVAMQIHVRKPVTLQVQRLTEPEKRVLGCRSDQAASVIPACDIKLALVMPKPAFYWEPAAGAQKPILEIRRITKNSYRLDHNIGSLNVSLQTAEISRALPDALFLTSEVLNAMDLQPAKTIFRPKPLKRYLGIRRSDATAETEPEPKPKRRK